jgi:hypothetical protein
VAKKIGEFERVLGCFGHFCENLKKKLEKKNRVMGGGDMTVLMQGVIPVSWGLGY